MSFRNNIKYLRKQRGMNQMQLAEAMGLWQTTISRLERGEGHPSLEVANKYASFFGVTIDALNSPDISQLEPNHVPVPTP